ncbi:hypothetical protein EYY96_06160 [Hafnia alvei]|uniref:Uncharacterized protein n=1 Tax=Hafnia alvei TaxID=569 RepID=A0ABD7Q8C5_HAFAL|nr:hypothetical protein EYY96_06160 [Hafnia alvei]
MLTPCWWPSRGKYRHYSSPDLPPDNNFANYLEFPTLRKYDYASFFSRTQTRSLPPWAAADPIRRLNNP